MTLADQFLRFLIAGSVVAAVDLAGYNGFLRHARGTRLAASLFSVTLALGVSFALNRNWVFAEANGGKWPVVEFLIITLVSAYCIQSLVVHSLSKHWRFPKSIARRMTGNVIDFLERNIIKAVAIGASLVWNFCWYRWYVFA